MNQIIWAVGSFAALGGGLGLLLALAAKLFRVKVDSRVPQVSEALPGANCGGCGYAGCEALAEAIVKGEAKITACTVGGGQTAEKIGKIMGEDPGRVEKVRAQVMCSGTAECAKRKYIYEGVHRLHCRSQAGRRGQGLPERMPGLGPPV